LRRPAGAGGRVMVDVLAIAIALVCFAVLYYTIEGLDRV
jgi:hypothetical protein